MKMDVMQFSGLSTGDGSKYDEEQEKKDQMLRATVASIQEKNPDCTLEYVEQEIVKEIDVRKREWNEDQKSENMILEHLLEMEVNQSTEVSHLIDTISNVCVDKGV